MENEPPEDEAPRRLVYHSTLRPWSPYSREEREANRAFFDRMAGFPWLTALVVALLVWFYLVQLVHEWPVALLFPRITSLEADLPMQIVGNRMGWLEPDLVRGGETWRLVSSTFLHASVLHIAGNAFVLFFLGRVVENIIGRSAFVITYVGSAVAGGVFSLWLVDGVSHGASGAVLGMLGAAVAFGLRYRHRLPPGLRDAFGLDLWFFVLLVALLSAVPNVDWAGHLGGFLFGMVMGASWQPRWFVPRPDPANMAFRVGLGTLASACFVFTVLLVGLRIAELPSFLPGDDLRALASAERRGDEEQRIAAAERLLERMPESEASLRMRFDVLAVAGLWDEAEALAGEFDPTPYNAVLALLLLGEDRFEASLTYMDRMEQADVVRLPRDLWDNGYAWALFNARPNDAKSRREGLKRIRSALRSDPDQPAYINTLAFGLFVDGKYLQAERKLADLMAGKEPLEVPDDIFLHAATLLELGRDAEAVANYLEAVAADFDGGFYRDEAREALQARGLIDSADPAGEQPLDVLAE